MRAREANGERGEKAPERARRHFALSAKLLEKIIVIQLSRGAGWGTAKLSVWMSALPMAIPNRPLKSPFPSFTQCVQR